MAKAFSLVRSSRDPNNDTAYMPAMQVTTPRKPNAKASSPRIRLKCMLVFLPASSLRLRRVDADRDQWTNDIYTPLRQ
jgi:hypothetical protein